MRADTFEGMRPFSAQLIRNTLMACVVASSAHAQASAVTRGSEADAVFMRDMIAHHRQAIEMSALIPARTTRKDMRLLGERIDVSQRDEITMMQRWLREHGADTTVAHHHMEGMAMPGMLTAGQLTQLAKARGAAFERLFLEGMIHHHEGALTMVAQLLAQRGAAQESQVFQYASDIDADQRAEIARMRRLLDGTRAARHH